MILGISLQYFLYNSEADYYASSASTIFNQDLLNRYKPKNHAYQLWLHKTTPRQQSLNMMSRHSNDFIWSSIEVLGKTIGRKLGKYHMVGVLISYICTNIDICILLNLEVCSTYTNDTTIIVLSMEFWIEGGLNFYWLCSKLNFAALQWNRIVSIEYEEPSVMPLNDTKLKQDVKVLISMYWKFCHLLLVAKEDEEQYS